LYEFPPSGGVYPSIVGVRHFKLNLYRDSDKFGEMCKVMDYLRLTFIIFLIVVVIIKIKRESDKLSKENKQGIYKYVSTILFSPFKIVNLLLIALYFVCLHFKQKYLLNEVEFLFVDHESTNPWKQLSDKVLLIIT